MRGTRRDSAQADFFLAPRGNDAIGDNTEGPDAFSVKAMSAVSSSSSMTSGSLVTPTVSATRTRPE